MFGWSLNSTFTAGIRNSQPRKSYNNKYMITSTQITNTEIFAFFKHWSFKKKLLEFLSYSAVKFCLKVGYFLTKLQILRVNYCRIINSWNVTFSRYFWNTNTTIYQYFFNLLDRTFNPWMPGLVVKKDMHI